MQADLLDWLLAGTALDALVANRITRGLRVQGEALPAVTVVHPDAYPIAEHLGGHDGLRESFVQVDAWATAGATQDGPEAAQAVADQVTARLHALSRTTQGSTLFIAAWLQSEGDMPDEDVDGVPASRVKQLFKVHHRPA